MSQRIKHFIFILLIIPFLSSCASTQKQAAAKANAQNFALKGYGRSLIQIKNAADSGDPDAEYALGYIYYYGEGVQRSPELARSWIEKAATQGQPLAVQALKIMEKHRPATVATNSAHKILQTSVTGAQKPATKTQLKPETNAANTAIAATTPALKTTIKVAAKAPVTKYSDDERHLLSMPSSRYTIQLLGRHEKAAIEKFAAMHDLTGEDTYVYQSRFQGKSWYVLLYGSYKNYNAAHHAIAKLPRNLQRLHPWVKPVKSVQHKIKHA